MYYPKKNNDKIIICVQFVLSQLGDKTDLHKLFKILYFADQKHLVKWGRAILPDYYIAMKHGPVPSRTYDLIKKIREEKIFAEDIADTNTFFRYQGQHNIELINKKIELSKLSESEIEALENSINENKNLTFKDLTNKSHDTAWQNSDENDEIPVVEIAKAGHASEELIRYICLNLENEHFI